MEPIPTSTPIELSHDVISACIDVHRGLGPGFAESLYQQAVSVELKRRTVPFEAGKQISVNYNGQEIGNHRLDFVVGDSIVLKLVAADKIEPLHYAQLRSYLRAAGKPVGLLVNFAGSRVDVRRVET